MMDLKYSSLIMMNLLFYNEFKKKKIKCIWNYWFSMLFILYSLFLITKSLYNNKLGKIWKKKTDLSVMIGFFWKQKKCEKIL